MSSIRVQLGLSAFAVNSRAGFSHRTANYIEDGKRVPSVETIERLAAALGVSPCWLAFGQEGPLPFKQKRCRAETYGLADPAPAPGGLPFEGRSRGVGARLNSRREQLGLSARALSRMTKKTQSDDDGDRVGDDKGGGVSVQQILNTEGGTTVPRVDNVEKLAVALGVAPCWLAYGDEIN